MSAAADGSAPEGPADDVLERLLGTTSQDGDGDGDRAGSGSQEDQHGVPEVMPFATYLDKVVAHPWIADLAHARIYRMIASHGFDDAGRPLFFKPYLFGLDPAIRRIMEYFRASAERLDTRKRILLLRGPVSSAKSTLVDLIKVGMERFSRTDEGALYAIKGCPMNEEPLHLLPAGARARLRAEHGVYVEGELCPVCRWRLENEHGGDPRRFEVQRVCFSEQGRVGIGTFLPSDPKSQDMAELVGSIDFSRIGEVGRESHPEAYAFDGELNVANRGVMEFIEMLKADERFLYVLLTLTQEQVIKAPRFPRIYADLCILAHTNESEYEAFVNDPTTEALQDRIIVVDVPYTLEVHQEERIYHKLLADRLERSPVAPHTLRMAAMVAVVSRLEPVDAADLDLVAKARLYDGERFGRWTDDDVRRMRRRAEREGMDGISPRFVVNRIATALIRAEGTTLTPERLLLEIREGLDSHPRFTREDREHYAELIAAVHDHYSEVARDIVRDVIVATDDTTLERLHDTYVGHVRAHVEGSQVPSHLVDPWGAALALPAAGVAAGAAASSADSTTRQGSRGGATQTGDQGASRERPPHADETFLRAVEERMGVREAAKESYRRQLLAKHDALVERRGGIHEGGHAHRRDGALYRALSSLLESRAGERLRVLMATGTRDPTVNRERAWVRARLVGRHGYDEMGAEALLRFVAREQAGARGLEAHREDSHSTPAARTRSAKERHEDAKGRTAPETTTDAHRDSGDEEDGARDDPAHFAAGSDDRSKHQVGARGDRPSSSNEPPNESLGQATDDAPSTALVVPGPRAMTPASTRLRSNEQATSPPTARKERIDHREEEAVHEDREDHDDRDELDDDLTPHTDGAGEGSR